MSDVMQLGSVGQQSNAVRVLCVQEMWHMDSVMSDVCSWEVLDSSRVQCSVLCLQDMWHTDTRLAVT
jgi:hypothetical protein